MGNLDVIPPRIPDGFGMNLCFNPSRFSWKGFGFLSNPRDSLEHFWIYLVDLLDLVSAHLWQKFQLNP